MASKTKLTTKEMELLVIIWRLKRLSYIKKHHGFNTSYDMGRSLARFFEGDAARYDQFAEILFNQFDNPKKIQKPIKFACDDDNKKQHTIQLDKDWLLLLCDMHYEEEKAS